MSGKKSAVNKDLLHRIAEVVPGASVDTVKNGNEAIEVTDLGPIKHLKIPVPEGGGVVVLEGYQGTGKTHVINALRSAGSKTGSLAVRDGAPRAEVNLFGVTLRMTRRMSRLGTLSVNNIEGRMSIAEVVDPKIQDPFAADAKRIKSLLSLTGAKADPAEFYDLVGGQALFDEVVPAGALDTDDLVEMSGNIKRALEKVSRDAKQEAETKMTQSNAERLAWKDVDLAAPADEEALRVAHDRAVREEAALEQKAKSAKEFEEEQVKAVTALAKLKKEYRGKSLADAQATQAAAQDLLTSAQREVADLEERLRLAKIELGKAEHREELARKDLEQATTFEAGAAALQETIDAKAPAQVSILDLDAAADKVRLASEAMQTGAMVRRAQDGLKRADELKTSSVQLTAFADKMRDAALATDSVLSRAVQTLDCPLYVSGGRVMTKTEDRGEELFEELSHGEKCKIVIAIAIKAVGPGGLVPIPQDFWEGLAPKSQREVAAQFENTGVLGVAARATDDPEIVAREFEAFPIGN